MNKGHYAEEDAAVLISKLLVGLVYLHSMNVMHRDIKPENLILKEEDGFDLKLADFGLAEYVNQKQHLFKRCGTPGYVAPEILDDMPYDTKVDIFSAGVILYILLTGCSPFYGETYNEILIKNKKCQVNFYLEDLKVQVTDQAIDLLKKMLEKNPAKRISAKECLKHPWIVANSKLEKTDFNPVSPYKTKQQSIIENQQKIKIHPDLTHHSIKNNLTQFQIMNQNLNVQSQKPQGIVISNPTKYNKNQTIIDDSPLNSPDTKMRSKEKHKPNFRQNNKQSNKSPQKKKQDV